MWTVRLSLFTAALAVAAVAAKIGNWENPMIATVLVVLAFIVMGALAAWAIIDFLVWCFGQHGHLQRTCWRAIRHSRHLLQRQRLSYDDLCEWQETTLASLVRCFGEVGHECIKSFESAGALMGGDSFGVDYPQHHVIRNQLAVLRDLIHQSRTRRFILVRKRRITATSRPGSPAA
jgi:hypothetical protein